MALSFDEFRKRLLDTAQKNDEARAAITARVAETASQHEPVRAVQAKEITPAMENRYQNQQMNPISFSQPQLSSRNRRSSQGSAGGETLLGKATGQDRGNGFAHGGGFSSTGERREAERPWYQTAYDAIGRGAGQVNRGITSTVDFVANAIPRVEGAIFGVEPEGTFTGQLLKPLTDATGYANDFVGNTTAALDEQIREDTKDSKAAQIATDLTSGVVSALPNAVLAFLSGGASAGGQLAAQGTGLSGTVANAANQVLHNPMFQLSAAQTLGSSYDEAKEAGASDIEAMTAATVSALLNALVEVGGGIETLPGELQNVDLSTREKVLEWVKSALDEGKEEVIQGVISNLTNKATFDSDRPYFSTEDDSAVVNPLRMAQEFGSGAAIGGILSGGQMLGNSIANRAAKKITVDDVMPKVGGEDNPSVSASADSSLYTREPSGEAAVAKAVEMAVNENAPTQQVGAESDIPLLLPEQSEITKQRGYPYEKKDAVYKVVDIPSEKVAEIEAYINTVSSAEARKKYKRILKNLFSGQKFTNANTVANEISYEIGIGSKGIGEIISRQPVNAQTLAMLEQLDEIVENAKYVASEPTSHPERSAINRTDIFEADTRIGNQDGKARLRVNSADQGNTLYFATNKMADTQSSQPRYVSESRGVERTGSATNSSIRSDSQNVNREITVDDVMPKVGDMGAKTSDFPHEVKESRGKTLPDYYEKANIPEEGRADNHYTAVTEAESLHNAKLRLEQDYEGEIEELSSKADWNNEDMDMSYMVLDDLRAEAEKTGDWDSFKQWAKLDQERGTEAGQALQSRAKRNRNSATGILAAAADILDAAGDKVDVDAVLGHVSELANRYDLANQTADVDALVQVIRDTASVRKTGFKQTKKGQKQSKYLNWALERIAGYAKSGALTGNADTDADITAANITDADTAYRFLQDFAYTGMLNVAADQNKASVGQRVMTVRRMGLLSKTSTVMRNLVANGAFDVVDTLARDVSVPIDMLFSKITGTRSVSADAGVLSKAKRQGMLDGIAMASLETSLDVNGRDINGKYVPNGTRTFKMSGNIVDRFFSTLEAVSGYALNVTDEMSKGGTAAEVQRGLDKLYSKGKIKATDDSLRAGGQQEALYRTFQDKTVLSNVTKGIRKGLNEAHLGDVGLGDALMPFAQVPANLADRAIDYSPAGLAKTSGKLVDALIKAKKGEFTAAKQAQVVQSLGRNITGTGLIALATWGALKGVIRVVNPGGDDENKDKSAFEKMQGQSGTQWNLSATLRAMRGESGEWQDDDVLMSIAFLEPFNANMTIGALLAEDLQLEDGVTAKTIMQDSFSGSLAALLDMPMFDTFGDIADAYTYSDKSRTGDKVLDAGKTLVADEIASLIPNAVKGIAQGMDEYQRDLYTKDDTWGQLGDQFRAVFDRNSLPIKQDSFGNDMTNDGKVLNALNNNILPGWISTYDTDDLMNEINRVAKESGSDSVYPTRKAPDKLTIDSVDHPLDQKQQTQYQKTYGQAERDSRSALIENDTYGNLTTEQQAIAHGYAETYSKQVASNTVNSDYELSDWVEDVKDKSPEEIAEAVIQRTVESLAKKQGKNKYDGLANMLEEGSIEDKVAISLLPDSTFELWERYGEKYKVPVSTLMDVISYGNSDESNGEKNAQGKDIEGKTHQDKMRKYLNGIKGLSPAQKRGIWKIAVSEKGECPW